MNSLKGKTTMTNTTNATAKNELATFAVITAQSLGMTFDEATKALHEGIADHTTKRDEALALGTDPLLASVVHDGMIFYIKSDGRPSQDVKDAGLFKDEDAFFEAVIDHVPVPVLMFVEIEKAVEHTTHAIGRFGDILDAWEETLADQSTVALAA